MLMVRADMGHAAWANAHPTTARLYDTALPQNRKWQAEE
jgi:hypothetical protein